MNVSRPLEVVTPTVDGAVLQVLALADRAFTPGQVARLVGDYSENGVRKVLARLNRQGIVTRERVGAAYVYAFNQVHLAAPAIRALATLKEQLVNKLRNELESWSTPPAYAALFGSAARGDMRADSDIDLFVVRSDEIAADAEDWRDGLSQVVALVTSWTGNDTRILEMTAAEARQGRANGQRVLVDIARDGIPLCGDPRLLPAERTRG